jgi:coenzyme F420 biosynthesis associated uncharacterized protein
MTGGPSIVDWDLAAETGARLVRPGPQIPADEARAAVAELRAAAVEARAHVRAYTGMDAPAGRSTVVVVDRPEWIRSNAYGLRALVDPVANRLQTAMPDSVRAIGSRVTALEAGAGLAFLAGKVLGQYELLPIETAPTAPSGPSAPSEPLGGGAAGESRSQEPGRLLLVAPNIVQVERELGVHPSDFRLWVCLHEETHRVQFTAVPWLRDHIVGRIRDLVEGAQAGLIGASERLPDVAAAIFAAIRGEPGQSLAEAFQTPAQREQLAEVTSLMSLLEGHADVVMDGVGPAVIPSVDTIRKSFQNRREHPTRIEAAMRRLLGLDAKLRQYRDGAAFVRGVVDEVGMAGFNRVWESPDTVPRLDELTDPAGWVRRMRGA